MLHTLSRSLLVVLVLASLILGVLGYHGTPIEAPQSQVAPGHAPSSVPSPTFGLWDALYHSLQLFVLNFERPGVMGWQVEVARLLAPAATAVAAAVLLADRVFLALRLSWTRWRGGHRVVCGLGRKGLAFVRSAQEHGIRVVAIERDAEDPRIALARALGVPVIVGDAAATKALARAGVRKAAELMVTCGADDTCVEVSLAALHWLDKARVKRSLLLAPHVSGHEVRTLLRNRLRRMGLQHVKLQEYCHEARTARMLFDHHHLERDRIGPSSKRFPQLILLGFGGMGDALLLQALKIAHYPNGKLLNVLLIDRHADALWARFKGRYPNFGRPKMHPIAEIEVVQGDVLTDAVIEKLRLAVMKENADVTIVVALDGESQSLALLERLPVEVRNQRVPVRVRIHDKGGVSQLIDEYRKPALEAEGQPSPRGLRPLELTTFGLVEASTDQADPLPFDRDDLAVAIHEQYLELMQGLRAQDAARGAVEGMAPGPAERPWDQLPDSWRDVNRHAADFVPVLFRSFKRRIVRNGAIGDEPAVRFKSDADLEAAGKIEHHRWYAERFLAGWQYAPERNDSELLHTCMVHWDELPALQKEKDVSQVGAYIAALHRLGCTLERIE